MAPVAEGHVAQNQQRQAAPRTSSAALIGRRWVLPGALPVTVERDARHHSCGIPGGVRDYFLESSSYAAGTGLGLREALLDDDGNETT